MAALALVPTAPPIVAKFDFDIEFQTKIAACVFKDKQFNDRVIDLIKPEYFQSNSEAAIVYAVSRYFSKYKTAPDITILMQLLKDDIKAKIIRSDLVDDVKDSVRKLVAEDITDAVFVSDQVAVFARHQAMENAMMPYLDLIARGEYDKAAKLVAEASSVCANEGDDDYEFFSDEAIEERERIKNERLTGASTGVTIPTGLKALDKCLFHGGWAKKEFYTLMGPPKIGKSIGLAYFAKCASMQGHNVLFVTLEVSKAMAAERIESSITGIDMTELVNNIADAKDKIIAIRSGVGKLFIREYPPNRMTPSMLKRLIQKLKSKGHKIDMVVVDYADIARADVVIPNNPIENSKSIYTEFRAIAVEEEVAVLSATQTNREGIKAITAKMEHAAEDINRIRIPDLVISINRTEEEKMRNEARLFFAASRNQQGDFTIFIKQALSRMAFVDSILKIE